MIDFLMNRRRTWALLGILTLIAFGAVSVRAQEPPDAGKTEKPAAKKEKPKPAAKKASPPRRPAHMHSGKTYMGREIADVMSYLGADWLLRDTRIQEEEPEKMLDALEIKPGQTVADVGAGVGFHALKLSKRVGPEGKVYATDVQPQMIAMLKRNAKMFNATNVIPLLCTQTDTKLPDGQVDLILMVDVYHECSQPEIVAQGLHKALKPKGRLVLVEFRGEDPEVPIKEEHKMTIAQVRKELEPQGFKLLKVHDFLPWQHIIVLEKTEKAEKPSSTPPKGETETPATPKAETKTKNEPPQSF